MAELQRVGDLPEDVDTDDCMTSYTHIYSPDLLKDQVAFITGGGSGIGLRIAEVLMRHGCDTVIASRNLEKLTEAAKKLMAATGRHCLPLTIDVRQPQTLSVATEQTAWAPSHPFHCSEQATRLRWPTACCSWPAAPPPI
uniref:Peroxisomal 2,4-dienoyl-CoA reductase [(3E)-enoyl-CoA-producing] n=1 Tax=Hucho hucho TaxID=62062 RepID=A0A4W5QD18_9TELE